MHTLIIGGGLSGLALADMLERRGSDYTLVEARARFGGRIKTAHHKGAAFDLGPAWFWPGQPRIAALADRFGLERFDQYCAGAQLFETEQGQVQSGRGFAAMEGSWRMQGGLDALTEALSAGLPANRKRLNAKVTAIADNGSDITVELARGDMIQTDRIVLALPPRLAADITMTPALPSEALFVMRAIPTWMAGQAKAVAVYDTPFWRDAGLSGDATSRLGPMVEIHDATPANGGQFALFGFIGVPPHMRCDKDWLNTQITAQFVRLFGARASTPVQLYLEDWALDPCTATDADHQPLYAHPTYGLPNTLKGIWDGRLHFAGTEVAPHFGGYLEGALEAAENAFATL